MVTERKTLVLRPPKSPNQPIAPVDYDQRFQDQFSNALRLYFNEIDNFASGLLSTYGGSILKFPNGAFHQDGVTTLSANITNNSTTPIQVASTADFPASGYILIGSEIIQYTTKTATTFDGTITRGVFTTTNVAHTAGADISEVQGVASSTTAGSVLFNATDVSNGVAVDPNDLSKIIFSVTGRYNVQISAQLLNYSTTEDNVTMWFEQDGNPIANTASIEQVNRNHGSSPGARILAFNIFVDIETAGSYITVKWSSDTGNTVVATYPAGTSPVHPVSPAIILTAQFVSALD